MKKGQPVWKAAPEYKPLLAKVVKLFPTLLGHINPKRIFLCSFIKRKSKHIAAIRPVRPPWTLFLKDYDYIVEFWNPKFEQSSNEYKHYVILHELAHIPSGGQVEFHKEYRKVVHHDLEDFAHLRTTYGIDLEDVNDVMKGEKQMKNKIHRFPRVFKIK